MIGGTFELDKQSWWERNVWGKLVAIAVAVRQSREPDPVMLSERAFRRSTRISARVVLVWEKRFCSSSEGQRYRTQSGSGNASRSLIPGFSANLFAMQ